MDNIIKVFAVIGMITTVVTLLHWLVLIRCRMAVKRNEKKRINKTLLILIVAGILLFLTVCLFLTGCGALKEIYRLDKAKQENCNPCHGGK